MRILNLTEPNLQVGSNPWPQGKDNKRTKTVYHNPVKIYKQ